jgi:hypothetical protein
MKKILLFILMVFSINYIKCAKPPEGAVKEILCKLTKLGTDGQPLLNAREGDFLNLIFKETKNDFDFINKKIGFISVHSKTIINGKYRYFGSLEFLISNNRDSVEYGRLYVFNKNQKDDSGGYDAAIVRQNKTPLPIDKIVEILADKHIPMTRQTVKFDDIPREILKHLPEAGADNLQVLNPHEGQYLNYIYDCPGRGFDFSGKKIGFLMPACVKAVKEEYFTQEIKRFQENTSTSPGLLYVFNDLQKYESSGYDGVVLYWYKERILSEKAVIKWLLKVQKKQNPEQY